MPTRRGWGMSAAALAFVVGGRVFGIVELYLLAATSVALVASAVAVVRVRFPQLATSRSLHPRRVHAGSTSRVELEVVNGASRRSPVVTVHDPFAGGARRARFLMAPLAPGERARAAYRLPTEDRGVYEIGPLEVVVTDPFGLAEARRPAAPVTRLVVYPRIHQIGPLPAVPAHDPMARETRASSTIGSGDDFFALRPYEVGDDTRRVHWPSSARLDDLMIRQDEMRRQSRVTILLDTRAGVHDDDSLEVAVSAAASVHETSRRDGALVRLVCTDGADSAAATAPAHGEAILEHLATVRAGRGESLTRLARRMGPHPGGTLVVVTTTAAPAADLRALARPRGRDGRVVTVLVETGTGSRGGERNVAAAAAAALGTVVAVSAHRPFPAAWAQALAVPAGSRR